MATRQDIQAIKERIDMVSLVSRYVSLVKSGSGYKGRCPFHKDDTPSFMVSPEKGLWHCFGCGEGGDVVAFLMKIERLSFVEAAKRLAEEAGVAFDSVDDGEREAMRRIVAAVAESYAANLANAREGRKARAYFESRGFDETAWKRFGLGYALPGWDHVKRAFGARYGIEKLVELGVLVEGDKGTYDRFRDRTIFPIYDLSGRPIAFGGRAFEDEQPKYLNSPTTPLFDKGRLLYGLSWAREAVREAKAAILVEGYTDVLTLHQAGIENAVCSMGTALTQGQADLLGRFVEEVVIAYDRDAAGSAASVRGMQILRNSGLAVRVAQLAEGEDPDSLVRKFGADAMRQAVADAAPFHRFYLETLAAMHDPRTVTGKERILAEARDFYRGVQSLPLQQEIARGVADLVDLPFEGVARELGGRPKRAVGDEGIDATPTRRFAEEEILLSLLLRGDIRWGTIAAVAGPDDFSAPYRPIAEALANAGESPIISELIEGLDEDAARRARELSLADNVFDRDTGRAVQDALDRLVRIPTLDRKLAELDREIRASAEAEDWGRWEALTREQHARMLEKRSLVSEKIARRGMHGRDQREARAEAEEDESR
ncbi:MAG: DNA primase [Thermotogota bacterium]